jgi:hypothetical protein
LYLPRASKKKGKDILVGILVYREGLLFEDNTSTNQSKPSMFF